MPAADGSPPELLLSIVAPVLNGAGFIAENVEIIRRELGSARIPYELIVVSDGSVDATVERAVAAGHPEVRVFHYDRNVGKGYAVKLGLLAGRGRYIGFIDSDLDLHPAELPTFLAAMERDALDAAIGSKRHPASRVDYPPRRRFYSWLYQQLIRALFDLDVRDTQVGMKLFRRELVDAVVPHLLAKRYAFDLELLAVAHDTGFPRIGEQPVRLEYSFTGSGVEPLAIAQALWDTAAIFYRLKVLRYYRRRRSVVENRGASPALTATVAVVGESDRDERQLAETLRGLDRLETKATTVTTALATGDETVGARRLRALEQATTDLVAFLRPGVVPATNWLGSLLPYFANPHVVAIGGPMLPATAGGLRVTGAAAVYESRFAAGPVSRRHVPGNLRATLDQPVDNLLVRRDAALASGAFARAARTGIDGDICRGLAKRGMVLFTPDAPVVAPMPTLVRPLLSTLHAHGRMRGGTVGAGGRVPISAAAPTGLALTALTLPALPLLPPGIRRGFVRLAACYVAGLAYASLHAGLRHRSAGVAATFAAAAPASHLAYGIGVLRGIVDARRTRSKPPSAADATPVGDTVSTLAPVERTSSPGAHQLAQTSTSARSRSRLSARTRTGD